jgi:hypothetical protein
MTKKKNQNRVMVTSEEIDSVWGNADFGTMPRENVIKFGLLKVASGYSQGYTSRGILKELGLVTDKLGMLTKRGKFCLYEYFGRNSNF